MDVDVVDNFLGPFGKFQLRSTLLIFLVKIPSAWFMACLIFTARSSLPGEIFCAPPPDIFVNNTTLWIEVAHAETYNRLENEESYDFCTAYENAGQRYLAPFGKSNDSDLVTCSEFAHRPTFYSLIHQYELVCSRQVLVALSQSFHLLGVLIGGIIAHYLLKVISPRRVMLVGMIFQIFLGIATGYAPTYGLHIFFRASVAATLSLMCIGIMIVSDITAGKYRVTCICLFEQFWSIGVILLPGIGSFWSSWGLIYVAISMPTIGLIVLYFWIPDSPRWLLKHGKVDEAKKILLRAAEINGKKDFLEKELANKLQALSEKMSEAPPGPNILSIWKCTTEVKQKLFAAHIGWSVYLMLYFGLLLHVRVMGRDYLKVNTVVAGISEIIGTFIGLYLILHTTQKWLWTSLLNIFTSMIALSAIFVPETIPPSQRMVIYMVTAMINKATVSTSLSMFITSMSEIVSQDKKKACNFSGVHCSRTLVLVAPFIGHCAIFGQLVPQIIMAYMNIAVSILIAAFIKTPRTLPKPIKITPTQEEFRETYISSKDSG